MSYYTRLTFNSLDWTEPSGEYGKCPGINNWECISGFGFEEWYRSNLFQINKNGEIWQYGYWQCFKNPRTNIPGIYKDFSVYTRFCEDGCTGDNGGRGYLVAKYDEIYVLNENERIAAINIFGNALNSIRNLLFNMGVDVDDNYDNQPNTFPKINIKFRLVDEKYLYNQKIDWPIRQGHARFGLYQM